MTPTTHTHCLALADTLAISRIAYLDAECTRIFRRIGQALRADRLTNKSS